jgi:ubiquinol-cytochrome c reductase iron-sulfur subunit
MKKPMNMSNLSKPARRSFLFSAAGVMVAAGTGIAAWPLISQMRPSADVGGSDDIIEIDVGLLQAGEKIVRRWKNVLVFIVRRTDAMLAAIQQPSFVARLADAESVTRQQPVYARNWHRSIDPHVSVLIGVCTKCACVPDYFGAEESGVSMAGGYVCPCCASHFDAAGRAYSGATSYNLPVPPSRFASATKLIIGRNPPGETFYFESIERL